MIRRLFLVLLVVVLGFIVWQTLLTNDPEEPLFGSRLEWGEETVLENGNICREIIREIGGIPQAGITSAFGPILLREDDVPRTESLVSKVCIETSNSVQFFDTTDVGSERLSNILEWDNSG